MEPILHDYVTPRERDHPCEGQSGPLWRYYRSRREGILWVLLLKKRRTFNPASGGIWS